MWHFFKRKKRDKVLRNVSTAFSIIESFNRRGLIHWQVKDKQLLIEESLALIELAHGQDGFKNFLDQVSQWQNFQLIRDAYERQRLDVESKAVREAQKKYAALTKADILRIRQNARAGLQEIDPEKLNLINEFDIFVIRATAPSSALATEDNGQLLALGHYDGRRVEMAMYDDIKNLLIANDNENS